MSYFSDYDLHLKLDKLLRTCKCSKISVVNIEDDEPDLTQTNTFQILNDDSIVFVACNGETVEFSAGGGIDTNFFITDISQTGNRTHDAAGFDTSIINIQDFLLTSNTVGGVVSLAAGSATNSIIAAEDGVARIYFDDGGGADKAGVRVNAVGVVLLQETGDFFFDVAAGTIPDLDATPDFTLGVNADGRIVTSTYADSIGPVALAPTAVTPGAYTNASITVDQEGRITLASSGTAGANTALSNLAAVAINTTLVSDTDNTDDIGTTSIGWRTGYFDTSVFTPLVVGGSTTTSDLFLKTTSGVGATGADMHFLVGSNGGTEAMTIFNDGSMVIGTGGTNPGIGTLVLEIVGNLRLTTSGGGDFYDIIPGSGGAGVYFGGFGGSAGGANFMLFPTNFETHILPMSDNGAAIGSVSQRWSDIFLAEGGVINWDNGDATLTQTGNVVELAGAALYVTLTTEQLRVGYDVSNYYSTTVSSTGGVTFNAVGSGSLFTFLDATRHTTNASPVSNDSAALGTTALQWSDVFLAEGGVINWDNGDATLTQVGNLVTLAGADFVAPNITANTAFFPDINDGASLGSTSSSFSDLFLAEGGVINWDNGDLTLTQTGDQLQLAGGNLDIVGSLQVDSIVNDTGLAHGTYTPTLFNTTNVDASTPRLCTYKRVGNTVTVSGQFDIDPTLTATATLLGMSLPVASALTTVYQLGGTANAMAIAAMSAGIEGDATNDRASIRFISTDTTNQPMTFMFQYEIL